MKEKIYNPADTNESSPAEGMASVNTFNPEEPDNTAKSGEGVPKNFNTEKDRRQHDDQKNENNR